MLDAALVVEPVAEDAALEPVTDDAPLALLLTTLEVAVEVPPVADEVPGLE